MINMQLANRMSAELLSQSCSTELCCSLANAFRFKGLLYLHESPVRTSSTSGIMHRKTRQCALVHLNRRVTYKTSFTPWFYISYAVLSMHLSVQLWLTFSSKTLKKIIWSDSLQNYVWITKQENNHAQHQWSLLQQHLPWLSEACYSQNTFLNSSFCFENYSLHRS